MSTVMFSVRRRHMAWAVALVMLLSAIWVVRSDQADAGVPPGTGIAVVYVAVGTGFPDSLGVGPGAGADGAPIIILPKDPPIPSPSATELERLDPKTLIIVGGTGVISAAMATALGVLLPNATISRIAGANRYETNAMFSATTFPIEGWASIPAAAFTGTSPATDVVVVGDVAYNTTDGILRAPIQLPHGAQILELKALVYDIVLGDIVVYLRRSNSSTGAIAAAAGTTGFAGGLVTVSDTTINAGTEIVDNETYAYDVWVTGALGNVIAISTVMVRYRLGASNG